MYIWQGRVLRWGYVHPHNHPHTQLKKSGIPHTHTHTQSMWGFHVKTGTGSGNIRGAGLFAISTHGVGLFAISSRDNLIRQFLLFLMPSFLFVNSLPLLLNFSLCHLL